MVKLYPDTIHMYWSSTRALLCEPMPGKMDAGEGTDGDAGVFIHNTSQHPCVDDPQSARATSHNNVHNLMILILHKPACHFVLNNTLRVYVPSN